MCQNEISGWQMLMRPKPIPPKDTHVYKLNTGLLDTDTVHSNEKRYNYGRTHENHMRAHDMRAHYSHRKRKTILATENENVNRERISIEQGSICAARARPSSTLTPAQHTCSVAQFTRVVKLTSETLEAGVKLMTSPPFDQSV